MSEPDFRVVLDGQPVAKERPRFSVRGGFARAYTPAKTRSYEDRLRMVAEVEMDHARLFDGALEVCVEAVLTIPKSWSRKRRDMAAVGRIRPTGRLDVDNIAKSLDALNGVVWKDDGQIVRLFVMKRYGNEPRLQITVRELEDDE